MLPLAALFVAPPLTAYAQSTDITLPTIQIEGTKQTDAVTGYVADQNVTATKTETPWIETPQSVSTVGAEQIRDQNIQQFDAVVRYSPGVKGETFGADPRNDWFLIRGFPSQNEATFLDGLQLFYTSFASWKLPPFALERIDILRGPSSVLYGGGSPGGVINAESKKPPAEPIHYLETGINNYGNRYVAFDVGGSLAVSGDHGQFYYRLTGMAKAGDTQVDFSKDDLYFVNPALTWKPNLDTTFTVLASVLHSNANSLNFLPYVGTVTPAPFGRISTSLFTGEPSMDTFRRDQQMIGYQFAHAFDNGVTFRQNARYSHVETLFQSLFGIGYATTPAAGDLARFNFVTNPNANQFDLDNQLEWKFATGTLHHTALVGIDVKHYTIEDIQAFALGAPINLINPVYTPTAPTSVAPGTNAFLTQRDAGFYLQDQIKVGPLTVVLNGRQDIASTDNDNRIGPDQSRNDGRTTGKIGVIYTSDVGLAPYVSYATSFNPVIGTNAATGQLLAPETGKQAEVGVKYQPNGFNGHFGVALFDLRRQNVLTTDPANPLLSMQTGEVRSRGVELEAVLNPLPGLKIIGAYTSYNFETMQDLDPANIGKTPPATPEQFASLWADYTLQDGPLQGVGFGGGVRYVGSSYADTANTLPVDPYTLFDAVVHYEVNGWRAAINFSNIADKIYVASCSSPTACFYGERRKIIGSLSYKW